MRVSRLEQWTLTPRLALGVVKGTRPTARLTASIQYMIEIPPAARSRWGVTEQQEMNEWRALWAETDPVPSYSYEARMVGLAIVIRYDF